MFDNISITNTELEELLNEEEEGKQQNHQHRRRRNQPSKNLRYLLESNDWIDIITPMHTIDEQYKDELLNKTTWPLFQIMPPIDEIQNYYGPKIAYYFAFMGFLGQWLTVLTVPGVVVFVCRTIRHDTIDTDEYTPFYGLFCFLWSILFVRMWQRHEKCLAYDFGTLVLSDPFGSDETSFAVDVGAVQRRPDFTGTIRTSPVTGQPEIYYPSYRRKLKYLFSATVTGIMLSVAFFVMILSLNLQGYITPKYERFHPFYYPRLSSLAEEGAIFDAKSNWKCFIPVVIHVLCIATLNTIYKTVARLLTDWENHVTQQAYENSLVLKRFLFEAFDCYICLFYLAFYERDVERLRMELVAVFNIDAIRRFALEVVLPMVLHWRAGIDTTSPGHPKDLGLDVYESFDHYMEVFIQLGYVTLFASAYPLSSLAMLVSVWIEIRSDMFKLTKVFQKPSNERISGIGMWKDLLTGMVWLSCLTNCLLFGFTSDQMLHYLPDLYIQNEEGETFLAEGKGRLVILLIFGIERILIYTGLIINRLIPTVPIDLSIKLRRRKFLLHESAFDKSKKTN